MRNPLGWLTRRLNSWDDICTNEDARHRTNTILGTLLVTFISLFMMFFNLFQGGFFMVGILAALVGLYGTMFLLQLFNPRYQRWAAWVFGLLALGMSHLLLYLGSSNGLAFLWIFIVPHITVLVVSLVDSLLYNAIWLGSIALVLNTPLRHWLRYPYSDDFRMLLPMVLLAIVACTYLAETVRLRTQNRLQSTAQQLSAFAFTDPLTGAYNRRALISHFGDINAASAEGLSFCVLDLDHFKNVNDTHGHFIGDEMLKHVVACIRRLMPANALLYRWGGEEFLLVLKTANATEAARVWEDIRGLVEATPLETPAGPVSMTLSIGGLCACDGSTIHQCIETADERLYHAKHSGRNCVVAAVPQPA